MHEYTDDNVKPDLCPECGTRLVYDESQDGYWCGECLVWLMGYMGAFIPFGEVERATKD